MLLDGENWEKAVELCCSKKLIFARTYMEVDCNGNVKKGWTLNL